MFNTKADEEKLNTTVYEKEGYDSLDDFFKVILEAKKGGNDDVVRTSLSKLNNEEKEAFIDWAKADSDFPEIVKIMIKGSLSKEAIDINKELYNSICYKLITNGFSLTTGQYPCDCESSSCVPYSVEFSDNELINGNVDYNCHKVHLYARDAQGKQYDKTIDYLDLDDLIKSIQHFQKDIRETFEECPKESGDWSDCLLDKNFLASLGQPKEADVNDNIYDSYIAYNKAFSLDFEDVPEDVVNKVAENLTYSFQYLTQLLIKGKVDEAPEAILKSVAGDVNKSLDYARMSEFENVPDIILNSIASDLAVSLEYAIYSNFKNLPEVIAESAKRALVEVDVSTYSPQDINDSLKYFYGVDMNFKNDADIKEWQKGEMKEIFAPGNDDSHR